MGQFMKLATGKMLSTSPPTPSVTAGGGAALWPIVQHDARSGGENPEAPRAERVLITLLPMPAVQYPQSGDHPPISPRWRRARYGGGGEQNP
jgi:hypothetical protein